jgi:hypothetical protein
VDGDRYNTKTTTQTSIVPSPTIGGSVSLNVDHTLAFIVGNSVVVVDSTDANNNFEGYIGAYNKHWKKAFLSFFADKFVDKTCFAIFSERPRENSRPTLIDSI